MSRFQLPAAKDIDRRLVLGAALFGVGWGLGGFCPGPALVSLATGSRSAMIFGVAMLLGMALHRAYNDLRSPHEELMKSESTPSVRGADHELRAHDSAALLWLERRDRSQ